MKRSIAWGIGTTLVAAAIVAACGNSISDTSGSGGGTGGKGTPASSSMATTGGSGGSGGTIGTGGSGMGGGDACTKACNHAAGCNQDICSLLPAAADCSTQEGMCLAACINGANCQDLTDAVNWATMGMMGNPPSLILCAAPCLQGGTGGGGQGGGAQACGTCAGGACMTELQNCGADMSQGGCASWLQCAVGCNFDPACTDACDVQFAAAAGLYDPIYACACTNCPTECAGNDPCGAHPPAGTGGAGGASASSTGTGP